MGSCAAPSAKGDDKFITTDYLQQCQRQGIELARQAGRYKGRRADPKRRAQVVALRKSGYSINKTAELAGYSAAQVKRIWAEVSQAEAKQHGAFVEDALTEADALAAVGQDERQEERA